MFYREKGHCCCSFFVCFFFFKKVTVEGLITSVCNQGPAGPATAKEPAEQGIAGSQYSGANWQGAMGQAVGQ